MAQQATMFNAAFLAGDNFYGDLPLGASDPRWDREFQEPFSAAVFGMPFYVALGNHDYSKNMLAAQFDYVRRDPSQRWKLPSKWYAVDFPPECPFVSVLVLDSNMGRLTPEERQSQLAWLESRLAQAQTSRWVIAVAHHPLFSNADSGDDASLAQQWGTLFKTYGVDFYISGHDHTLQHLEIKDWPISFLVSGAGGAKLHELRRADRGPFSRSLHGFLHLSMTTNQARAAFISERGEVLHEFVRTGSGNVQVVQTTGMDRATEARKSVPD